MEQLKAQGVTPCLAVILVGEDPASQVYVRGKINDCGPVRHGEPEHPVCRRPPPRRNCWPQVSALAQDPAVHGILVQLPLPAQIDEKAVIDAIPPEKDVGRLLPA